MSALTALVLVPPSSPVLASNGTFLFVPHSQFFTGRQKQDREREQQRERRGEREKEKLFHEHASLVVTAATTTRNANKHSSTDTFKATSSTKPQYPSPSYTGQSSSVTTKTMGWTGHTSSQECPPTSLNTRRSAHVAITTGSHPQGSSGRSPAHPPADRMTLSRAAPPS